MKRILADAELKKLADRVLEIYQESGHSEFFAPDARDLVLGILKELDEEMGKAFPKKRPGD